MNRGISLCRFHTITTTYYRQADAVMLVFDVTNRNSFKCLNQWCEEVKRNSKEGIRCLLLGNKSDLDRQVTMEEAKEWADYHHMPYVEVNI